MAQKDRIVCRISVQTVANRRARRDEATVPPAHAEFSEPELDVFRSIERRRERKASLR